MAIDIAHLARSVPSFPIHREMKLGELESARRSLKRRIGWTALLVDAYSRVCNEIAELRDVYVRWPVPYLYRHPYPVASITVHRADQVGNERLVWGRIGFSDTQPIEATQDCIDGLTTLPLQDICADGLRMENRPAPLRALAWWLLMGWSGRKRAKHLGTFSISSLGGWGALNAHHPLVTTTSLAMGPIQPNGSCDVVLICDHRVLDGALAARSLERLEQCLREVSLGTLQAATPTPLAA